MCVNVVTIQIFSFRFVSFQFSFRISQIFVVFRTSNFAKFVFFNFSNFANFAKFLCFFRENELRKTPFFHEKRNETNFKKKP